MIRYFLISIFFLFVGIAHSETEFQKLDRAFSQKKANDILELNSLYLTKLSELKKRARSGDEVINIDKRMIALKEENRRYQTQLSSSFNLTGKSAKVKAGYTFVPFTVGTRMFRDKKYTWVEIAPKFAEGYEINFVNERKSPLEFSVTSAGLVTLVAAFGDSPALLKDGWKEIGKTVRQPLPAKAGVFIYQKYLNAGDYTISSKTVLGIRLVKEK